MAASICGNGSFSASSKKVNDFRRCTRLSPSLHIWRQTKAFSGDIEIDEITPDAAASDGGDFHASNVARVCYGNVIKPSERKQNGIGVTEELILVPIDGDMQRCGAIETTENVGIASKCLTRACSSNSSGLKKSKSTDRRCPSCRARAVRPARYRPSKTPCCLRDRSVSHIAVVMVSGCQATFRSSPIGYRDERAVISASGIP